MHKKKSSYPTYDKVCLSCGTPFVGRHHTAKWCGPACEKYERRKRVEARRKKISSEERTVKRLKANAQVRMKLADRRKWIDKYKREKGCKDCGYKRLAAALDFDHVKGEKVANISTMVNMIRPWDMVLAEIKKCEVVCATCHRERTHRRNKARQ